MTKLLLSVRSADEARTAIAAGADVVDVKEPAHGSLGRSDSATLQAVAIELAGAPHVLLTAALGELFSAAARTDSTEMLRTTVADEKSHVEIPSRVQYVKFGLSHVRSQNDWRERWQAALVALPAHVRPVAVAYADESAADAPDALDVLETGESLGCSILLVDTYAKDGRSLLEHWVPGRIAEVIAETQRRGMKIALAGSLRLAEAPRLLELRPDFLAVRGGACRGGRTGSLDAELTARWAEMVADHNARIKPIESETAAGGETWATLL